MLQAGGPAGQGVTSVPLCTELRGRHDDQEGPSCASYNQLRGRRNSSSAAGGREDCRLRGGQGSGGSPDVRVTWRGSRKPHGSPLERAGASFR